jgi:deoxyribodipyrimidine photolyase
MKKSKEINEINQDIFVSITKAEEQLEVLSTQFTEYYKKIKKEYTKSLLEEKHTLLKKIAEGENIDLNTLKSKYLKAKEILCLSETQQVNVNEELLDRIEVNDVTYYYENKEKGKVYDYNYIEVGIYKNKNIILN